MQIIEPDYSKLPKGEQGQETEDMTHQLFDHYSYGNTNAFYAIGIVNRYTVDLLSGKCYQINEAQVLRQAIEDADGPHQEERALAKANGLEMPTKYVVVNTKTEGFGH